MHQPPRSSRRLVRAVILTDARRPSSRLTSDVPPFKPEASGWKALESLTYEAPMLGAAEPSEQRGSETQEKKCGVEDPPHSGGRAGLRFCRNCVSWRPAANFADWLNSNGQTADFREAPLARALVRACSQWRVSQGAWFAATDRTHETVEADRSGGVACAFTLPGCFSVSVHRRCLDCGGPMDGCEDPYCEDAEGRSHRHFDLGAKLSQVRRDCVGGLRGLCYRPPPPLAPPPARYHPVPTNPVFAPVCFDEPPLEGPMGDESWPAEEIPAAKRRPSQATTPP